MADRVVVWSWAVLVMACGSWACFPEPPPLDEGEPDALTDVADADPSPETDAPPALEGPESVEASTDRASDVELLWQASPGASGYHVERCAADACEPAAAWTILTAEPLTATRYLDTTAEAPGLPPAPSWIDATDSLPDRVRITWEEVAAPPAPRYRYRVVALGPGGETARSDEATGHRAERPVIGYQVQADAAGWAAAPDGLEGAWDDGDAAPPTVDPGSVSASLGTYAEFVRLVAAGAAATPGTARSYRVRALTDYGPGPASEEANGHRAAGPLAYQWERSEGSEAEAFAPLPGGTTVSFDDTTAPSDGAVRWYRVVVSAAGASPEASEAVAGARQPPPGVPGGVTATDDRETHVLVSWQPVHGAAGYHVYRDGVRLTEGAGVLGTSYQDAEAPPPPASWSAPADLVATTVHTDRVDLTWQAPERPIGAWVSYQVRAHSPSGEGALSAEASGRRAAPALLGYEVEAEPEGEPESWHATGSLEPTWAHEDPPQGTVIGGELSVTQGDHRGYVRLAVTGGTVQVAPSVTYRVRGQLQGDDWTPPSEPATGARAVGALTRQWQRSAGAESSDFDDLEEAGASFDDPSAPSDGETRWYQVLMTAPGAEPRILGPVEGWRLALVEVDGGYEHTCGLARDGRVWCWGDGRWGQLGTGAFEGADPLPPSRVPGVDGVVAVHSGSGMTCARTALGATWCWGGQFLGNGESSSTPAPLQIPALDSAVSIAIGPTNNCAAFSDGVVKCWGDDGMLHGSGTNEIRLTPTLHVTSATGQALAGVMDVAAGPEHTCAALSSGDVWCWGVASSMLGTDVGECEFFCLYAMHAGSLTNASQVTVGSLHSCAVLGSGEVACWGFNHVGQLGVEVSEASEPVLVPGVSSAQDIASTDRSTCVRLADETVRCWGNNSHGQLGDGTQVSHSTTPVTVALGDSAVGVSSIGSGSSHHCAIRGGDVYCWGANSRGQLGIDSSVSQSNVSVRVVLP